MKKLKTSIQNSQFLKIFLCLLFFMSYELGVTSYESFAQQNNDLEFTLDATANTVPLPKIFQPNIDLSGRGLHREITWPQEVAAKEVLDLWQQDIGFNGLYRLQYNLWDIQQLAQNKDLQNKLLSNYEAIIKNITSAGGSVILDIFGTPAGLGKVLDKKSTPWDLKAFKAIIKDTIRYLSCNKRYNVWYEIWNAPDMDDFFLGRQQEYLSLYRAVAEAIKELEAETKMHIPLGGPSVSWWFQNVESNNILTPENSLIYELIKFCYHYHLPLDFITWHGYSTAPDAEKESTIYKKSVVNLIRDWLTYFRFDRNTPLIVDEWNYDRNANVLAERKEKSFISASYIPSRLKNMFEAGIDNQTYFCLEDFQDNKEGITRNVGIFSYDSGHSEYKGNPKSIYNVLRMLNNLGKDMFALKLNDEFVGAIATKAQDQIILLIFNYIDPDIAMNYFSTNIALLNAAERKALLNIIESKKLEKILLHQLDISSLRINNKVKNALKKALELSDRAKTFASQPRNIKIGIKNLKDNHLYQRYAVDSSCASDCKFVPIEEKEISIADTYQETLSLNPYSVNLIILRKKPKEPEVIPSVPAEQPQVQNVEESTKAP
jgi:hypothetical protein